MPGSRQVPSVTGPTIRQGNRVSTLERKLFPTVDIRDQVILFSFSGALEDDLVSPKWPALYTTKLGLLVAYLNVAGSGDDVTIDLKDDDGNVVRTLTVPDGETFGLDAVPLTVVMMKTLTATVTQAAGAEDLTIAGVPTIQ